MRFFMFWLAAQAQQKTHDRSQPWVLVEMLSLGSTKPRSRAADYDDQHQQSNLPNNVYH
jgi:hypothetical protein